MSEGYKAVSEWIEDGDGSEIEIFHLFIGNEQITDFPIDENDAHIMAASKDMLLALEGLTGEGFEPDYGSDKLGAVWVTAGEWKIIKGTIAKARGNV